MSKRIPSQLLKRLVLLDPIEGSTTPVEGLTNDELMPLLFRSSLAKNKSELADEVDLLKLQLKEITRRLKMETERADFLSIELESLKEDRDENWIPVDDSNVAIGDQVIVELDQFEMIEKIEALKLSRERLSMGVTSEADTIRELLEAL